MKNNEKYYINKFGVKVCTDIREQPLIKFVDNKWSGFVVSFQSMSVVPTVDVIEKGKRVCYRLPKSLLIWVENLIETGWTTNNKAFPCEMTIVEDGNTYYVEISEGFGAECTTKEYIQHQVNFMMEAIEEIEETFRTKLKEERASLAKSFKECKNKTNLQVSIYFSRKLCELFEKYCNEKRKC